MPRIIEVGGDGDLPDFLKELMGQATGPREHHTLPGDVATLRERFLERQARRPFAPGDLVAFVEGKGLGIPVQGPMIVIRYLTTPLAIHDTTDSWANRIYPHAESDMIVGALMSAERVYREMYLWSGYCQPYEMSDLEAEALSTVDPLHAAGRPQEDGVIPLHGGVAAESA